LRGRDPTIGLRMLKLCVRVGDVAATLCELK
jgi:hypothetical protein